MLFIPVMPSLIYLQCHMILQNKIIQSLLINLNNNLAEYSYSFFYFLFLIYGLNF